MVSLVDTFNGYEEAHLKVAEEWGLHELVETREKLLINAVDSFIITLRGLDWTCKAKLRRQYMSIQGSRRVRRKHLCTLGIG